MTVAQTSQTRSKTRPKASDTDGKPRPRHRSASTPGKPRSARRQDFPGRAQPGDTPRSRRLPITEDNRVNWAKVMDEYMTLMDISLGEVAGCLDLTEQAINDRRNGKWPNIALTELERMANIFGFPVSLFLEPPTNMIRWCLDNRPEYFTSRNTAAAA